MKIAPREISALLHQPESRFHAYLLYGHDEGLVRERARKLASHFADNLDDPFAVSHLTGPDVAADKASLSDSLNALPAFGGLRLVMLSGAGTEMTEAVKLAFEHLHEGARLVIQARDVNTRHALVKFCDQQPSCASIGCYQDDSRSLGELAREIFAKDSVKIETNALALLLSRLGNDRAVSRMEIEKLVLFAGSGGTLNAKDMIPSNNPQVCELLATSLGGHSALYIMNQLMNSYDMRDANNKTTLATRTRQNKKNNNKNNNRGRRNNHKKNNRTRGKKGRGRN